MAREDLNESIVGRISRLFENIAASPAGKKELRRYDHAIQFDLSDAQPISIQIRNGETSVRLGSIENADFLTSLAIKTNMQTMHALIEKRMTLGEALLLGDAVAYGSTVKEYAIAWLSGLLRTDFSLQR